MHVIQIRIVCLFVVMHKFSHSVRKFGALDLQLLGLMMDFTITVQVKTFTVAIMYLTQQQVKRLISRIEKKNACIPQN